VADAAPQALVLGGEIGSLLRVAVRAASSSAMPSHLEPLRVRPERRFACGLVVAGAASGPGREVSGGREDAHVVADLSDHDLGGAPGDPGQAGGESDAGGERAQLFLDRFGGGDLGSQPALGKIGQDLRVGGAGDERVEHRAPGRAEDVGGDAVELDAGVFQRLVQPVGLALALGDLRLALPRQGSQLALRLGRYEAAAQRAGFDELTQPLRVADVGLATRNLLDVPRVAQRQFEVVFEDVPDQTGYQ